MTHTPGPWKIVFTSITARGVRAEKGFICFLPKPTHYSGQDERYENDLEENHADAHLIHAAPDLLEACENIMKLISRTTFPDPDAVGAIVSPAIAKARGEA
jgi:hypothetical protein